MLLKKFTVLAVSLSLMLFACSKPSESPTTPTSPTGSTLTYPKTIHFVRAPRGHSGSDLTHYIEYNDQKKVAKITIKNVDRINKIVNFLYDASGKLSSIQTYGGVYDPSTIQPPFNSYVTHKVTYSSQRVDVKLLDSLKVLPPSAKNYIKYGPSGSIIEYGTCCDSRYTYQSTTNVDGNVTEFSYLDRSGIKTVNSTDRNISLYYTTIPHPFVNTPELRIYSLIDDEQDYGFYTNEILVQNRYCLSSVNNGLLVDFNDLIGSGTSASGYSYSLNEDGYPTSLKTTVNGRVKRELEVTYMKL